MQDVDEPAVLQNFSATLMEDSVGCVQVPFFGFFAFSRYTEEKMVDCCMIFFRGFLFLLLQNGLKNGSLEICVLSVPENLCFESLLGTLDHEDCFTSFFFLLQRKTTTSTFPFIHQETFALSIKISAGLRVAALASGSGPGRQFARARSKPTK